MSADRSAGNEPGRRLVIGALLALTVLLGCFPMGDFDVWWHLRSGQLILERRAIPRLDWFTYTNAERPWIDLYWLFQIGLALLYRVGGASALVLLKPLTGVTIVGLTLLARRTPARAWPLAVAWLAPVVMLTGRLCERPELASLVLLAGFLAVLGRAAERPKWLWALPLMQVVWVNCHGFFVLGPLVLSMYGAEIVLARVWPRGRAEAYPPAKLLAMVSAATLLACVVSPYGLRAVALPIEQFHKLGSTGIYRESIGELKTVGDFVARAGLWNPYLLAYFVVVGMGAASFVLAARRGRVAPFRLLVFVAGTYLGWQATRNNSLLAVMAVFVTLWNLDDWAALAPPAPAQPSRRGRRPLLPRRRRNPNLVLVAMLAALGMFTASGRLYSWAGEGRSIGLGERKDWYAHGACAFAARPDMPERIVAYNLGQAAVCIAHAAPGHKLFMDPRLEVNTQETFERYLAGMRKLWRGEPGWEEPLGIDYDKPAEMPALLIERGPIGRAANNLQRDPRWRLVYADEVAGVFVATSLAEARGVKPWGQ